jgi:FkbM family methyltransferase
MDTTMNGDPVRMRSEGREGPIVSYSQNAEDVRLLRVFDDLVDGFYVDVGAGDPTEYSVTRLFYDRGWSGINIEPGPMFERLATERQRDVNLNVAIGQAEEVRSFWVSTPHPGLSTFYADAANDDLPDGFRFKPKSVECKPLSEILARHGRGRRIDFMSIDVEGAEEEVIRSIDFGSNRPTVIIVEAVSPLTREPTHAFWEPVLMEAGYEFAAFDGLNRFYVERMRADLIPILAYPMSVFDQFVTAPVQELEVDLVKKDAQLTETQELLTQTQTRLAETEANVERLAQSLAQAHAEAVQARHDLATVYQSRTWRAGRVVATVANPIRHVMNGRRPTIRRRLSPKRGYTTFVRRGQPWHFPRKPLHRSWKKAPSPLDRLVVRLGNPNEPLDAARASALAAQLRELESADERSLITRRLSWAERQAVLETEAVVHLVHGQSRETAIGGRGWAGRDELVVVVDARALQDPMYGPRGVGMHSRRVLEATRAAAGKQTLVLLTDAELPDLATETAEIADRIVFTPYALRDENVVLFVQLSPMTASCAPTVPFLESRACATASVVYDFIPTEFPAAYLSSTGSALANRVRIEALRRYDLLLPISASTEAQCQAILGDGPTTSVTGVGDPLDGVHEGQAPVEGPFMLVPVGGDPRKNAAAAVAALAAHHGERGASLRALITGTLTAGQIDALHQLAERVGLPEGTVEVRGYVRSEEMAALYAQAELALVPSVTEGFSIPVAEAIRRGTPVVASDIAPHRELVGRGPWLAAADDVDALGRAISAVRQDKEGVLSSQREALANTADPESVSQRVKTALEGLLRTQGNEPTSPARRDARPRLAVISPFPPQSSGVADYTAFTFREVAQYAEVEVFTQPPNMPGPWRLHPISASPHLDGKFDAVINIVGNSHFHFPALDLLGAFGGATVAHDDRMFESYCFDRGNAWMAGFLARRGHASRPEEIEEMMGDLDRLPSIGYDIIARQSSPLIVHSSTLADRIFEETGIRSEVVPFVPYNVPSLKSIDAAARDAARNALGLASDTLHVGTFGIVDRRTKGTDLVLGALSWFKTWNVPAHLHVVGQVPDSEGEALVAQMSELGIRGQVTLYGRVSRTELERALLAVDVAVQMRMSSVLTISGALTDCIAFGVPTVTTQELANELDAPSYVVSTGSSASSLLIAEAIDGLRSRRRDELESLDNERRKYLARRSADSYAQGLLAALGLAVR